MTLFCNVLYRVRWCYQVSYVGYVVRGSAVELLDPAVGQTRGEARRASTQRFTMLL